MLTLMADAWTELRRAGDEDVEEVAGILEEAAAWLRARGIDQWPATWPRRWLAASIREAECYLALRDGRAAGTLSLQRADVPMWGDLPPDALYLHRLAVRRRDAGLGRSLLAWAEQAAAAAGRRYLRLDCLAGNPGLRAYYERAGYRHRGDVRVARWACSLYEKEVAGLGPGSGEVAAAGPRLAPDGPDAGPEVPAFRGGTGPRRDVDLRSNRALIDLIEPAEPGSRR